MLQPVPRHQIGRRGRRPGASKVGPDPVDIHVGQRIKLRRTMVHVSQETMAGAIGVTFQQVQKYESGFNRVSASRLFDIAKVLGVTIAYFFEDMEGATNGRVTPQSMSPERIDTVHGASVDDDPMQRTETLEIVRSYWRIHNEDLRRNVKELLANISKRE